MPRPLYTEATLLAGQADELVPRDTGTLAGSQSVQVEQDGPTITAAVGYGGAEYQGLIFRMELKEIETGVTVTA